MATFENGYNDAGFNDFAKKIATSIESTNEKNLSSDIKAEKPTTNQDEEGHVGKRLLLELKHTLEFYVPFQKFAVMLDVTNDGIPTLLGAHPDSGSTFNMFVRKVNNDFVYDLFINIDEVPMVEDKPNTQAVHKLEYTNLTYRELGLVLNHHVTLSRLSCRVVYYKGEPEFTKKVYGPLRPR